MPIPVTMKINQERKRGKRKKERIETKALSIEMKRHLVEMNIFPERNSRILELVIFE